MAGINKGALNIFILFLFIVIGVSLNVVYAEDGNKMTESVAEKIIGPMFSGKYEKNLYQMYNVECQRNITLLNFALSKRIMENILYNRPLPKNIQDLDPNLFPNKKIPVCPYGRPYEIVFDSNGFPITIKSHIHTFEEFKKRIHISETEKYMKHLSSKEKLIYIRNVVKSMAYDSNVAVLKTAIINYYLENKKYPTSLNDLCPDYIGNVPPSPFGEKYKYNPKTGDIPWHNHLNRLNK